MQRLKWSRVSGKFKAKRFRLKLDNDIAGSNRFTENGSFSELRQTNPPCGCGFSDSQSYSQLRLDNG